MNKQLPITTILVTAYAKAPQGSAMYEVYKYSGIVLEIDPKTNYIVNAEFTFVTELANDFFRRLTIGYDLSNGVDDLIERIESHYFTPSTNSVITTLKSAYKRYIESQPRKSDNS
jgi:hypothetical protein